PIDFLAGGIYAMTTVKVWGCVTMQQDVPLRGDRIKARRKHLRLSQEEAAARAGVDLSYWSQLENNRIENPGLRTIQRIAQALETTMSYLLGETDDPEPIRVREEAAHDSRLYDAHLPPDPEDILDLERAVRRANEILQRMKRRQRDDQ